MKTDLIVPGNSWPLNDPEEKARRERYRINNLLFRGKYEQVWEQWHDRVTKNWDQKDMRIALIVANFCKVLTLLCADLLYGEQGEHFGAKCADKKADAGLQGIISTNHFNITAYEVGGIAASMRGDGVYKLVVESGKVRILAQPATSWFPLVEQSNVKRIKQHILVWEEEYGGEKYLRKEVHDKGVIWNFAYKLDGSRIGDQVNLKDLNISRPEKEETKIPDRFLVIHNPNWSVDDQLYGVDDYEDLDSLVAELAIMLSRNSMVLAKHTDPNMYGDPALLIHNEKTGGYELPIGGSFFPVSPDAKLPPGYLTWDGKLEAAEKQIDRLIELLFYISETSPAAFGLDKNGVAESGAALKKRLVRTLAKVNRKKLYADIAAKEVLEVAQMLDVQWGGASYTPERPEIEWQDGLPEDELEQAQVVGQRIKDGTMSQLEGIMKLDKCDEATARKKLKQIQEEKDAALPAWSRSVSGGQGDQGVGAGQAPTNPFRQGQGAASGQGSTGQVE